MSVVDREAALTRRRKLLKGLSASNAIRIGGGLFAVIVLAAMFAPWLSTHDPVAQDLTKRLLPPFWYAGTDPAHLLGTDHLGRDYLARLLYGARVSLGVGLGVTLSAGLIGTMLGLAAGYFGGRVDMFVSFVVTTRLSLPIVLVALAAVALGGASLRTLVIVLSLLLWDRFAVVVRAAAQGLRNREFVQATQSFGASHLYIMLRSILPNLRNTLIVVATLEIANVILLEAALSFLGLGAQPPTPSWGLMIAEGREHILFDPWLIAFPGAGLCMLILAVNLLGDGVRDAFDEKRD